MDKIIKFEAGKKYNDGTRIFEITKRTKTFVSYVVIDHYGRCNEKRKEEKKAKINLWGNKEVFFANPYEVHANNVIL